MRPIRSRPCFSRLAVGSLPVWQGSVPGTGGPTSATGQVINAYYLNVRSGPGTGYGVMTTVPGGTVVTLLGRSTGSGWVKVQLVGGTVGWVSANYLSTSVPVSSLPLTN